MQNTCILLQIYMIGIFNLHIGLTSVVYLLPLAQHCQEVRTLSGPDQERSWINPAPQRPPVDTRGATPVAGLIGKSDDRNIQERRDSTRLK